MTERDRDWLEAHAEEIAALPADDPLHRALEASELDLDLDLAAKDEENARLSDALTGLPVPDLGPILSEIPDREARNPATRWKWATVASMAAAATFAALWLWPTKTPAPSPDPVAEPAQTPAALMAVKFWHQTCPACREIDPRYAEIRREFADRPVLFVTFDMSTERSRAQSKMLAERLGIEDLYEENFGATGYVVLVDTQTRREVDRLTAGQDTETMREKLASSLAPQS
jgi:thiol-disulfide isomerase/thioredoxin